MKKWLIIAIYLVLVFSLSSCGNQEFKSQSNIASVTVMTTTTEDVTKIFAINFEDSYISYPKGVKKDISIEDLTKLYKIMNSLSFFDMANRPSTKNKHEVTISTTSGKLKTFGVSSYEYPDYLVNFLRRSSETLGFDITTGLEYAPLKWKFKYFDNNTKDYYTIQDYPSNNPNFMSYYPEAKIGSNRYVNEDLFEYAKTYECKLQASRTNMVCKLQIEIVLMYAEIKSVTIEQYDSNYKKIESREYGLKSGNLVDHFSYDKSIPEGYFWLPRDGYGSLTTYANSYYIFIVEDNLDNYYKTAIYFGTD